jgi:hypothetical protein
MGSKDHILLAACAAAAALAMTSTVHAVNVPLVNPGFDTKINSPGGGFNYEGTHYNVGDPIPNHTFVAGVVPDGVLADSHTGTTITDGSGNPASGGLAGYAGSPAVNTGILFDTRDFNAGQGPTGPGAFITMPASGPAAIYQVNSGGPYLPDTHYVFTVEVSDRFAIQPNDVITFPSTVDCSLMQDVTEVTGEVQTFTAPTNGNTSILTLDYTTGASPPVGAIGFVLRASGATGGAATQIVFDNVVLTANPVPEPATIGLLVLGAGGLLARRRRT